MGKINQKEFSKFLSEIHTFTLERPAFSCRHELEVMINSFGRPPVRFLIMEFTVNNIIFEFTFSSLYQIIISGQNVDLENVKDDEMELISNQFAFLDQARALQIEGEEETHRQNVQKCIKKIKQMSEELPAGDFRIDYYNDLIQLPTQEELRQRIEEQKAEHLALKEAKEEENKIACVEVEQSFMVRFLCHLTTCTPITIPGFIILAVSILPSMYLFGPSLGILLYLCIGPVSSHIVDTLMHVRKEGKEKQKLQLSEKPRIKTYDELQEEEDNELSRQIDALGEAK